jgi:hypothetical protein
MHLISPCDTSCLPRYSRPRCSSYTVDADNDVCLVWETGPYRLPSTTHISHCGKDYSRHCNITERTISTSVVRGLGLGYASILWGGWVDPRYNFLHPPSVSCGFSRPFPSCRLGIGCIPVTKNRNRRHPAAEGRKSRLSSPFFLLEVTRKTPPCRRYR